MSASRAKQLSQGRKTKRNGNGTKYAHTKKKGIKKLPNFIKNSDSKRRRSSR